MLPFATLALIPKFEDLIVILLIFVLLFGATKVPQIARDLGRSVSEFKKGMREGQEEEKKAAESKEIAKKDAENKPENPT